MRRRVMLLMCCLAAIGTISVADDDVETYRSKLGQQLEEIGKSPDTAAERLEQLGCVLFKLKALEDPENGTEWDFSEWQDRWSDASPEAIEWRKDNDRKALEVIRSINPEELKDKADRLNYKILCWLLEMDVDGQRFSSELLAIREDVGPQELVPATLKRMPTATEYDYKNILSRLERIPDRINQTIDLLKRGLEEKTTLPPVVVKAVVETVGKYGREDESELLSSFTKFPSSFSDERQTQLRGRAAELYRDRAAPAFRELHRFLREKYLPGAAGDLRNRKEWYAHEVRRHTSTERKPHEIHQFGLEEVARIRGEMDEAIPKDKFKGFAEFKRFLLEDRQFFFDSEEALLVAYRDTAKRVDPELVSLFGRLPRTPYGVKPDRSGGELPAWYDVGSPDGSRAGYFYVNTSDLTLHPKWRMDGVFLHEAVPGHHLQKTLAIEPRKPELPWYRRFADYTAFEEGWGLYAEGLGECLGLYDDHYSKFGRLTLEIWRAARLVADTGVNDQGWSDEMAKKYLQENTYLSEEEIKGEIQRYFGTPGQALAYKIGERKIKELRDYAERELADGFKIREFHDYLLSVGPLPLDILESQIREWVNEQKQEQPKR